MVAKLKILVPALTALLVVAMGAPGASADLFTTESAPTTLRGTQQSANSFDFEAGTVACSTAKYVGTASTTATSSIVLTPEYSGCTIFGMSAEVSMNGCSYILKVNGAGSTEGTGEISCPAGKEITIKWPPILTTKCIIHMAAGGSFGMSFTNIGGGTTREFVFHVTATGGFSYSQTPGTGLGACTARSLAAGGKFTGTVAFTAEADGGGSHVGIFLS